MESLSLIIPAYNEEHRIGKTLDYYSVYLSSNIKDFEIIVVLNGCKDNTLNVILNYQKKYPKIIKYLNFTNPIGKGPAVIEGFKAANNELIGFVDADMSTPPEAFHDLVLKINGYDGILASRWIKGATIPIQQRLPRRIASRSFNILVRILFNLNVNDTQCGCKLFKKNAIKSIINDIGKTKWAFDIDVLYRLNKKGYKVTEIPTYWSDAKDSHLNVTKTSIEMFLSIIRLRLIYSNLEVIVKSYNKIHDLILKK